MIGKTISHYQVTEKLGEGGMGVFYRARDAHLDRSVAIKVLPPEAVADPERKRRFVKEAKSASALNHPNIIHVYDIDSADGIDYIAMEYVAGRTLAQLIRHRAMKTGEALNYAVQIADALAAAHAAGIVHRDLKPANIMVTESGLVKVLDFGLAKLMEVAPGGESATTLTVLPATEQGAVVGTAPYMSPEQAQGRAVDARSDIFSFGSVLYEMLTGQRAFQGESNVSTLAAILEKEPRPLGEIAKNTPAEIERILTRCLRKDPQRRWQSMADLKIALQELKEESDSGKLSGVAAPAQRRSASLRIILPAVMVIIAVMLGVLWRQSRKPSVPVQSKNERLTLDTGLTNNPSISSDGKLIACASDRNGQGDLDIYVQQVSLPQASARQLTDNRANDIQPSFSPDGRIVFRSERGGGGLYIIDALGGGEERWIVDHGWRPSFSPDGAMILYTEVADPDSMGPSRMYLISPEGGDKKPFQSEFLVGAGGSIGPMAIWSPDGKHVLFPGYRATDPETKDWWVAPIDGGPAVQTGAVLSISKTGAAYNPIPMAWFRNRIIFCKGTTIDGINLFSMEIDAKNWQISGTPLTLTSGLEVQAEPSIAKDGRMVFSSAKMKISIFSLPLDPVQGTATGEPQKVTRDEMVKTQPAISRDGSKLVYGAYGSISSGTMKVRSREIGSGRETDVATTSMSFLFFPKISADGSEIVYGDLINKKWTSFLVAGETSGSRRICDDCVIRCFYSNSKDAIVQYGTDLVRQNLSDGNRTPILKIGAGTIEDADLSADDRWLAFQIAKPSGGFAIYVAPLGGEPVSEREWIPVADESTHQQSPRWSKDGNMLYFISERDGKSCIWAQRLNPLTKASSGSPFAVYHVHQSRLWFNRPRNWGAISIARDQLYFSMAEISGNIYMTKLEGN
jgi:serine/threonine protein kinase